MNYIVAGNLNWGPSFATPGSYTSLTAYFSPYIGAHTLLAGGYVDITPSSGPALHFTATSLTISAVPEPSTYAALAGLVVFGVVVIRRRAGTS